MRIQWFCVKQCTLEFTKRNIQLISNIGHHAGGAILKIDSTIL